MNVQQSLVLGIIQGLTEFLPVSSTAHLILAHDLGAAPPSEHAHTFDTFIQIGTVFPVLLYFWRDWLELGRAAVRVARRGVRFTSDKHERMVLLLIIGSIPAGVLGLLLEKYIEPLADPANVTAKLLIGCALIGVGILMLWAERTSAQNRGTSRIGPADALIVGLAQASALFPGVSRSGATITAGLVVGLTREAAARFSFLLMTPVMFAATGYKGFKVLRGIEPLSAGEWQSMLIATVVAAITGYFAIAFLIGWLRTRSLGFFALYRFAVGAWAIGLYFMQRP